MFFALVAIVMLPDFPSNTRRWFTAEEIQLAQLRMLEDVRLEYIWRDEHCLMAQTGWRDRPGLQGGQVV